MVDKSTKAICPFFCKSVNSKNLKKARLCKFHKAIILCVTKCGLMTSLEQAIILYLCN